MKNKTLVLISAAIITVAAFVLTAGLSLLHGSATEGASAIAETSLPVSSVTEADDFDAPQEAPESTDEEAEEEAEIGITCKNESCDYPYHFKYDVVVAVYEHATGNLVSQKVYTDDQVWFDVEELHRGVYDRGECIYDPNGKYASNEEDICLVNAKYRVEVFAIWYADEYGSGELAFAYSYGADSDMIEMWGSGILYDGGDLFIDYVDALIAEQMAELEAGKAVAPAPEEAITSIIGFDIISLPVYPYSQSVWTGDFFEPFGRQTPRFPYIEE